MMKKRRVIAIVCLSLLALLAGSSLAATPDEATLRSWVQKMKNDSRGPFKHIRWFCNDGSIQLPKEYACSERGGGVQHGEWTDRVKILRDNGYYIANVFADVGYVSNDFRNPTNTMVNNWQYSAGAGIDLVTYYDQVFRVDFAINRYREYGFFFHIETPFSRW